MLRNSEIEMLNELSHERQVRTKTLYVSLQILSSNACHTLAELRRKRLVKRVERGVWVITAKGMKAIHET